MEFSKIFSFICILYFVSVLGEFLESGGMKFKLLKLIMEMIISLFLLIAWKYKDDFVSEKYQKKLEEYFYKKTDK